MEYELRDAIALLSRTPAALNALLRGLPDNWAQATEGENTWTPQQIITHLIKTEHENWMVRTRFLLEHGESRAFEPFGREGQARGTEGKSLPELLDEFSRVRGAKLAELQAMGIKPADLQRRGRHPNFGAVTLSQLLATWVAHDLTHLHQLSRVLAHQYRDAVGPWIRFLGVLHCEGHSEAG